MASDTTETVAETPRQAARRLAAAALRDGFLPQALHAYTDAAGNAIYFRIRLKHPDFAHAPPAIRARYGQDKWIRPMRSNGAGFVLGEPAFAEGKPLYRLHELMTRPETMVWLVEGERCADALAKRGLLATTSGGADSASRAVSPSGPITTPPASGMPKPFATLCSAWTARCVCSMWRASICRRRATPWIGSKRIRLPR